MKRYPLIGLKTGVQVGKSIDLKNTVLFLKTKTASISTSTQVACDIWTLMKFGEGNISWTSAQEINYERDRKKLDDVNPGDEQPLEVSLEGKATFVTSLTSEPATIHEIIRGKDLATQTMKFKGTGEPWLINYGCPPYACELELHIIPQLECPTLEVLGEAHLFRFFRSPSIGWDPSTKRVACNGACHILDPYVIRPNFFSLYSAELGANGKLAMSDLKPLQDLGESWPADDRE